MGNLEHEGPGSLNAKAPKGMKWGERETEQGERETPDHLIPSFPFPPATGNPPPTTAEHPEPNTLGRCYEGIGGRLRLTLHKHARGAGRRADKVIGGWFYAS